MRRVGVILAVLLSLSVHLYGRTERDTIYTTDGDRIIITYEIANSANQTTIRFTGQQKKLGRTNTKYKDLSKVAVMFFDRTGNYSSDVSITNLVPEAFMTPSDVLYDESQDGFFLVEAKPKLSFTVKTNTEIAIPMYLAYKPKKGKYILFSKSMDLRIPLETRKSPTTEPEQLPITSIIEMDPDNGATCKILEVVNAAEISISKTTKLPFHDELEEDIKYLRQKRREITDKETVARISGVIEKYDSLKRCLEEKDSAEQQRRQQEEESRIREKEQAIKAQNDSIAAAQQEAAEEEKKRNLWMIAGGVILAITAFIGNQIFQSIRNKRNQAQMMTMQQNIADKAEAEAKRRAQDTIRSQRKKAVNEAKQTATNTIRKKTTIDVNGKSKKASI